MLLKKSLHIQHCVAQIVTVRVRRLLLEQVPDSDQKLPEWPRFYTLQCLSLFTAECNRKLECPWPEVGFRLSGDLRRQVADDPVCCVRAGQIRGYVGKSRYGIRHGKRAPNCFGHSL